MSDPVTVFAVDDHPAFLATVEMVVNATPGFELVGTATSGHEALASLSARPAPALVLSDVRMPGMSGPELAAHLAVELPETVVVLLSSYGLDELPSSVRSAPSVAGFRPKADLSPDALRDAWDQARGSNTRYATGG